MSAYAMPPSNDGADERTLGAQAIQLLYGLLRALRLYDHSNQVVQVQLREITETFAAFPGEETVLLVLGEYFYVNSVRLRPTHAQSGLFRAFSNELRGRGLAGLKVRRELHVQELEAFAMRVIRLRSAEGAPALAAESLAMGVRSIVPILERDLAGMGADQLLEEAEHSREQDERAHARQLYQGALAGAQRVIAHSASSGRPALQQARRVVQPLVDCILQNEYSIVGLTALKEHDEHTYAHCVNVSVLSIRIGQVLGLPRHELADLGVAALLHDVGKVAVPVSVLQKPGQLEPEEWAAIRRHPLEGLKLVCRMPHLSRLTLETARVAYEHHQTLDGSGYPASAGAARASTSARIVAVADFFDALTAHRAYRTRPLTPFEAMHLLLRTERRKFDTAPIWGLLRAVGHYPAGTLLESRTGFVVMSLSPALEDSHRPHCQVLVRPDGSTPSDDAPEYWDPMPAADSVARVIPPEEFPGSAARPLAA